MHYIKHALHLYDSAVEPLCDACILVCTLPTSEHQLGLMKLLMTVQGVLQILGALHAIHAVAVFFKLMSPALYSPGVGRRNMYTLVILNSLNLAVACR